MPRHTGFERDDILGNWYPTNSVTAVLGPAEGEKTVEALRQAGFRDDDLHLWTGPEVVAPVDAGARDNAVKRTLRELQRELNDNDHNLNVYEQAARRGMAIIAVRAPEEEQRQRAHHVLRAHFAHQIKFYGRFAIADLSP